eukprot:jgi/Chlat1/2619/Chrsp178S02464
MALWSRSWQHWQAVRLLLLVCVATLVCCESQLAQEPGNPQGHANVTGFVIPRKYMRAVSVTTAAECIDSCAVTLSSFTSEDLFDKSLNVSARQQAFVFNGLDVGVYNVSTACANTSCTAVPRNLTLQVDEGQGFGAANISIEYTPQLPLWLKYRIPAAAGIFATLQVAGTFVISGLFG